MATGRWSQSTPTKMLCEKFTICTMSQPTLAEVTISVLQWTTKYFLTQHLQIGGTLSVTKTRHLCLYKVWCFEGTEITCCCTPASSANIVGKSPDHEYRISDIATHVMSCTIKRLMEIHQYWTVPRQTQRMTTPSFAKKWRLQYNHLRKGSPLESTTFQQN